VVEEKRQCPDCTNVAEAVERDAQEVDRDSIEPGEIQRITSIRTSFDDSSAYLRHLNDSVMHQKVQRTVVHHLWVKKKNDEAQRHISLLAPLIQK
jgi:hypothetical protein